MEGYNALTSKVAKMMSFLDSGWITSLSVMFTTCVEEDTSDGMLQRQSLRRMLVSWDSFSVGSEQQLTIGLS